MNQQFRVAIIDDEAEARALVKIHLKRHANLNLIGEASDGPKALELLTNSKADIVFLDIQMPGYSGIEVLTRLSKIPQVVFITAYDHFAIKAFELNAIDYLLKPFSAERFDQAVTKVTERLSPPINPNLITQLMVQLQDRSSSPYLERLAYKNGNLTAYLSVASIRYIRSADQYIEVYLDDQKYLIRRSLDALEQQLSPDDFLRIHRSAIVRLSLVQSIQQDEFRRFQVILRSGESLPLSQVRKSILIARLKAE